MKKLMIILLVGMLSLGLSGIAFATTSGDQTVEGNVTSSISIVFPDDVSNYPLVASDTHGIEENVEVTNTKPCVTSNTPYHVQINCDTPSTGRGTAGYMNKYTSPDYASPAVTLTEVFSFKVSSQDGTNTSSSSDYTAIPTAATTIATITDTATDDDGFVTQLSYSQPVHYNDPVLESGSKYRIVITFTAVADPASG